MDDTVRQVENAEHAKDGRVASLHDDWPARENAQVAMRERSDMLILLRRRFFATFGGHGVRVGVCVCGHRHEWL